MSEDATELDPGWAGRFEALTRARISALEAQVAKLTEERDEWQSQQQVTSARLQKVKQERDSEHAAAQQAQERLDQFDAYGMPNVAAALDRIEKAEARVRELEEALLKAVDCVSKFKSYYITDNQLGLNPTANAEVREANATLKRFKALLASTEPEK